MKVIHIAIIDDGVYKYYENIKLENDLYVNNQMKVVDRKKTEKIYNTHGSICCSIIYKYFESCIVTSIKVLDEEMKGTSDKLIKSIEWCIKNKIDIINLSIGSVDIEDKVLLSDVISQAYRKGIIIIAANKNDDSLTYPASFTNVIGVKTENKNIYLKEDKYFYLLKPKNGIEIIACGKHSLINKNGEMEYTSNCNSFAAPVITSIVGKLIYKNKDINNKNIKRFLRIASQDILIDNNSINKI